MLRKIREVLLTQYIGAMVIALVAAEGFKQLILIVVLPLNLYLMQIVNSPRRGSSVLGPAPRLWDAWPVSIGSAVEGVLAFAVAYLLLRWLYLQPPQPPGEREPAAAPND